MKEISKRQDGNVLDRNDRIAGQDSGSRGRAAHVVDHQSLRYIQMDTHVSDIG